MVHSRLLRIRPHRGAKPTSTHWSLHSWIREPAITMQGPIARTNRLF
jgi:hypothetical protein